MMLCAVTWRRVTYADACFCSMASSPRLATIKSTSPKTDPLAVLSQLAARMSPEALLSAEDMGAMLGYPARYIRETIALAPGFPM